jgi:cyclophilin family peptidyl-prolyl cis-trans isomerase
MVDTGFFDRIAAYRVVPGFLVGFGVPFTNTKKWPDIKDDPNVGIQNPVFKRGMIAFAGYAPNTRGTEAFISYQDSTSLGRSAWGNPFGIVTSGMDVLDKFYSGYGDLAQFGGNAPDPNRIKTEGGGFLQKEYPNLDYITSCARVTTNKAGGKGLGAPQTTTTTSSPLPAAPPAAPATLPMPTCSADFCGSGIGWDGKAVCLCHQNCLMPSTDLPCCLGFKEQCPAVYALGNPQPAQTSAAQTTAQTQGKATTQTQGKAATQTTTQTQGKAGKAGKKGKKIIKGPANPQGR